MKNVKNFFEKLMSDDERDHHFTKYEILMYGVVVPIVLVIVMGIVGTLDSYY